MFKEGSEPEERQEEIFDVSNFLVAPKNNYSGVIERNLRGSNLQKWNKEDLFTPFSSNFVEGLRIPELHSLDEKEKESIENEKSRLKEKIKGKVLVDLGAGSRNGMAFLAQELGAKVYIRVDKFWPDDESIPLDPLKDLSAGVRIKGETQVVTIKSDILDFISRLPNESVCITINGIDFSIIPSEEYHKALAEEISRVVSPDGIAFGVNSESLSVISNTRIYTADALEKYK